MEHRNLYNSLSYNITNIDLTNDEKETMIAAMPTLSVKEKETIYLLMLHDCIKDNPSSKVIFPYKSKQISNDKLEVKIDALPIRLKRIIHKFIKIVNEQT